jgi:hypothetical protein
VSLVIVDLDFGSGDALVVLGRVEDELAQR